MVKSRISLSKRMLYAPIVKVRVVNLALWPKTVSLVAAKVEFCSNVMLGMV